MRVLHVYSGNMFGGVETLLLTLARYRQLCTAMEPHYALCFEGRLSEELTATGVPVNLMGRVRISQPMTVLRSRRALGDLLRREDFDLVICHSAWSQAIFGPVVRRAKLPLIFWLHDAATGRHWLERWARRTPPDLALCNSKFTASLLPLIYSRTRAEVIYCPVSLPEARYSKADLAALRAELDTPQDATVIIQVSRMEEWKGHSTHLEALGKLRDIPNWVCWQVGGGQRPHEEQYLIKLKRTAASLGILDRVRFLGQRSDVPKLLAAADIYCQPNIGFEAFGITFIEALLANLPVIATAIGGSKEVVTDSCGVLVPPDDVAALVASLRSFIQDQTLRLRLGAEGPSRAQMLCDPATRIEQLNKLLAGTLRYKTA
ncbi:MAG: glycosyl transferase family 1 [Acidobacteria bacterium]|nr:MAG: glycosyl transferase family 1 [Acidobacteriota bacterium]